MAYFTEFCSFIAQLHSFNSSEMIHKQIPSVLIILKLSYFGKYSSLKMEVFLISGSWDQKIDSSLTNHEPLIPTLYHYEEGHRCIVGKLKDQKWSLEEHQH